MRARPGEAQTARLQEVRWFKGKMRATGGRGVWAWVWSRQGKGEGEGGHDVAMGWRETQEEEDVGAGRQ